MIYNVCESPDFKHCWYMHLRRFLVYVKAYHEKYLDQIENVV